MDHINLPSVRHTKTIHLSTEDGPAVTIEADQACQRPTCCGRMTVHSRWLKRLPDTPAYGGPCALEVRMARYRCAGCGRTQTPPLGCEDRDFNMTRRLAWYIFRSGCNESLAQVARRVDLPESTVRAVFWRTAHDADLAFEPEAPAALGIDEVHLSGYAYGVFIDLETSRVIDLLPGYSRGAIADAIRRLRGYERIQVISMDYHGPYAAAVRDVYGDDRPAIVIDKRHILETARKAMNRVRTRTKTRMKHGTRRRLSALMNSRPHKLSEGDRAYLAKALGSHPQLGQAYRLKEAFYAIFARTDRAEAEAAFETWAASIPKPLWGRDFEPVVTTVRARWRDVFALFDWPGVTNAKTENANGRIKQLHRQVRGFTRNEANDLAGFKAFRQMVLHAHGPRAPGETAVRIAARAVLDGKALASPRSHEEIEDMVGGPVYWDAASAGPEAVEVIDDLPPAQTCWQS